jgi:hypothetical protein
MGMCIVIQGDISDGFVAYGPFKTNDHAKTWIHETDFFAVRGSSIMPLREPKSESSGDSKN